MPHEPFLRPSLPSTALFVLLCAGVLAVLLLAIRRARSVHPAGLLAAALAWLALTPALVSTIQPGDLSAIRLMLLGNVGAVVLALSPVGRNLAALPPLFWVVFQAFRLPLELLLHRWYVEGAIPVTMTWEGRNLDVVTGIAAAVLGLWGLRGSVSRGVIVVFEALGFALLLNVVFVAVHSAPTPLRAFYDGPALQLPYHLPYAYIVTICVAGALLGHVVLLRSLLRRSGPAGREVRPGL